MVLSSRTRYQTVSLVFIYIKKDIEYCSMEWFAQPKVVNQVSDSQAILLACSLFGTKALNDLDLSCSSTKNLKKQTSSCNTKVMANILTAL